MPDEKQIATIEDISLKLRELKSIEKFTDYLLTIKNIDINNYIYFNFVDYYYIQIPSQTVYATFNDFQDCFLLKQTGIQEVMGKNLLKIFVVVGNKFIDYISDVIIKRKQQENFDESDILKFSNLVFNDVELLKKYNISSTNICSYIMSIQEKDINVLYSQVKELIDMKC